MSKINNTSSELKPDEIYNDIITTLANHINLKLKSAQKDKLISDENDYTALKLNSGQMKEYCNLYNPQQLKLQLVQGGVLIKIDFDNLFYLPLISATWIEKENPADDNTHLILNQKKINYWIGFNMSNSLILNSDEINDLPELMRIIKSEIKSVEKMNGNKRYTPFSLEFNAVAESIKEVLF